MLMLCWGVLLTVDTGPASAVDPLQLEIVAEPLAVPADGTFELTVDVGGLDPTLLLAVTIYGVVDDAEQLDGELGVALHGVEVGPLAEVVRPDGRVVVRVPIRSADSGAGGDGDRLWIPERGVHPVVVSVRGPDGVVASARTNLIRGPAADGQARAVAMVLGVAAETDGVATGTTGGLTVADAIAALGLAPELPITVVLGPGVVDELAADPTAAVAFAAAAGDRPVVAVADPALDPSALAVIGQGDIQRRALEDDVDELARVGLVAVPGVATVDGRPTDEGAALLIDAGVNLVLDVHRAGGTTGHLRPADRRLDIVDLETASALLGPGTASARAQRALADIVIEAGTEPNADDARTDSVSVVAVVDAIADPVATLSPWFDALRQGAEVRPVALTDVADVVAAEELRAALRPLQDSARLADPLHDARHLLALYATTYVDGPLSPTEYEVALVEVLDVAISDDQRAEALATMVDQLSAELAAISLPPDQTVTLAARSGTLPLTIENAATGERQVLLRFRSDKFEVEEEGTIVSVPPGIRSIDIHIEARSLGVSPLEVTALTPDGSRVLSTSRFEVRSTAVPGLGLAISGVAFVLLALWWFLSIRRRRSDHPSRTESTANDGDGSQHQGDTPFDRGEAVAEGSLGV